MEPRRQKNTRHALKVANASNSVSSTPRNAGVVGKIWCRRAVPRVRKKIGRTDFMNLSGASSGRVRKGQPTIGSWRGCVDPRGRARSRQNGRNCTNGTFRGRSPLIKTTQKIYYFHGTSAPEKNASRARNRQRVELRSDNPTQRGRRWKDLVQTRRSAGQIKNPGAQTF